MNPQFIDLRFKGSNIKIGDYRAMSKDTTVSVHLIDKTVVPNYEELLGDLFSAGQTIASFHSEK